MFGRPLILVCGLLIVFTPNEAHTALPYSMQLQLVLDPSTTDCPDHETITSSVRQRLGYSPFGGNQGSLFRVSVHADALGYKASIEHFSPERTLVGERHIQSESTKCEDLFDAVALSLALAAGPETPREWGPRPRPAEGPTRARRSDLWTPFFFQASDLVQQPVALETSWFTGILSTFGRGPLPGIALQGGLRFQWAHLSLELDGELNVPIPYDANHARGTTTLEITRILLNPALCLRNRTVGACMRIEGGVMLVVGSPLENESTHLAPHLGAGLSLDWRLFYAGHGYLALKGALVVPIVRPRFQADTIEVWETPSLQGSFGLSGGMRF